MRTIGSRELKATLGEVLREVRENGEVFIVTHHGRPVARLIPDRSSDDEATTFGRIWTEMDALAAEIGREWPSDVTAARAVDEDRREI